MRTRPDHHETRRTSTRGIALLGIFAVFLLTSAVPGDARGGHGGHGGRGGHHGRHGHHGFRHGHHGFIGPSIVAPIWPYWDPYLDPYGSPPIITPTPQVYIQSAPSSWYYCAPAQGYYPYVPQCPEGWQPVAPVPPGAVQPPSPQPSWYYCANPQGYYPYVQECPGGWQPVAPTTSEGGVPGTEALRDARTPSQGLP